ncbi:flagellar brake protein [Sporosarcina contaminans]|uniref:Flagellar brake protein n=1 Tax=Sporosarcina contaminans TaxID=633403 RepID=A0ABW3U1D7_9BACL
MRLSIGTTIIIDKDYTELGDKYKSKVVDIEEGFFMIDYPTHIETNRTAFFMDGTQLLISFVEDKMSYAFRSEVKGRLNRGIPMLKMNYPGDDQLIKIQRREFVRVETAIDVAVCLDGVYEQFVAADISAGGIALYLSSKDFFAENDTVHLTIALPFEKDEVKYVRTEAEVIRIWEKDKRKIASLQFLQVDDIDRRNIIRFCFERQLMERNEK